MPLRSPGLLPVPHALLGLLVLGGAAPALAADVTPDQAAALEAQVRDAAGSLVGPAVKLPARLVRITAAGDHYDIVLPLASADPNAPVHMSAAARPAENGTWAIDKVRLDTPVTFTVQVPQAVKAGSVPAVPGAPGPSLIYVPVTYTVDLIGQDGHITWDPSFATPSVYTASTQSMALHSVGGLIPHDSKAGPSSSVTTMRPAGPGRVDILMEGSVSDYRVTSAAGDNPLNLAMQKLRAEVALNGVSRNKGVALVQAMTGVIVAGLNSTPAAQATPGTGKFAPPHIAPELFRALLVAVQDLASDFTLAESIDGLATTAQGQAIGIERIRLGMSGRSAAGMLQAGMELGVEGLALPDMPLGDMAVLIPKRIAVHPVVSGLGMAELIRMADAAIDGREPAPADLAGLFSHGGIAAGLESMTVEVGGAVFNGQGKLLLTGPSADEVSGTAQVTADNFDALVQRIATIPALAQGVPVLALAKGIGRTVDNRLVWDITYKAGKVLVNNLDLTAMAGGGAPAAPAPRAPGANPGGLPKAPVAPGRQQAPNWGK